MKRTKWVLGLCVLAALFGSGCSDSDRSTVIPFDVSSTLDEDTVSEIMSEVVIPTIEAVDLSFLAPPAPPPGMPKGDPGCEQTTDLCMSGTLDMCPSGGSGVDFLFADCSSESGAMIDGSISFDFAGASASVLFAVSFNQLALSGSMALTEEQGCLRETLDQFSVQSPSRTASVDASLLYCGSRWPDSGDVDVSISGNGAAYMFHVVFDGSSDATVTVFDLSGSEVLAGCMVNLATGRATCEMP